MQRKRKRGRGRERENDRMTGERKRERERKSSKQALGQGGKAITLHRYGMYLLLPPTAKSCCCRCGTDRLDTALLEEGNFPVN